MSTRLDEFDRPMDLDDWNRFFGAAVDPADYVQGCEVDLYIRIEEDLTELWSAAADPADRLTITEIRVIADRLADYAARTVTD